MLLLTILNHKRGMMFILLLLTRRQYVALLKFPQNFFSVARSVFLQSCPLLNNN